MLASLPDMTHRRLRALVERGGGPVGALAGLERGLASAVLCEGVSSNDLAGAAVAGAGVAGRGAQRSGGACARARERHARVRGRSRRDTRSTKSCPTVPRCCSRRVTCRRRSTVRGWRSSGTRAATPNGLDDARELGATLARAGVTVVSGLAIGIDGAVHEGALDAGGTVIGVVATGLDVVYPRRHRTLFDRVRGVRPDHERAGVRHAASSTRVPGAQPDHRGARARSPSWWRPR